MRLPHLDQVIELQRGEAGLLGWAVADKCRRTLARTGADRPVPGALLLALPALQRVAKRLQALDQRELNVVGVPSRKPHRFRLRYDEVVAMMLYVFPEPISAARVPLGKVQQKALNLARWIDFQPQ